MYLNTCTMYAYNVLLQSSTVCSSMCMSIWYSTTSSHLNISAKVKQVTS